MNIQLVANLSANGQLILAQHANAYQAPDEISGMGFAKAMECGNIILGRTTYDMFAPIMKDAFSHLDVVVLSTKNTEHNVYAAKNAEDAIAYLEHKGYHTACVVGGTQTFRAFLEKTLADELFFNLFPIAIQGGGVLETTPSTVIHYHLSDVNTNGDVAMLHYIKNK